VGSSDVLTGFTPAPRDPPGQATKSGAAEI
jgi:hypothetical protein